MNEERDYFIDLKVGLEFKGCEIPCEEILIAPIKAFIKNHIKCYKNTTRIIDMETKIYEAGREEPDIEGT